MQELKTVLILNLSAFESFRTCRTIVILGYKLTGLKWSVSYNGSKGYLNSIEINCEGSQPEQTNRIDMVENTAKCGKLKNKEVTIKWSNETGVIVEIV